MRLIPLSLIWFLLAAIVVVLQMFPVTGFLLMFVMAIGWSVFLVNIGFVSLAFEALLGGTSRVWLLFPLAWFLGYHVVAWQSQTEAAGFYANINAFNAGKYLQFSPTTENIVFQSNASGTLSAQTFVQQFDLPIAFEESRSLRSAGHFVYTIGTGSYCHRIRNSPRMRAALVSSTGDFKRVRDKQRPWHKAKVVESPDDKCTISSPYDPVGAVVKVGVDTEALKSFLLDYELTTITLQNSNGQKVSLKSGHAFPLSKFPRPIAGCGLYGGAAAWNCIFEFGRDPNLVGSISATEVVAKALGLQSSDFKTETRKFGGTKYLDLERVPRTNENMSLKLLDEALADQTKRAGVHDLSGLAENPSIYSSKADSIINAIKLRVPVSDQSRDTVRSFGDLLAGLPEPDFQRIAPRIATELLSDSALEREGNFGPLRARLKELRAQ